MIINIIDIITTINQQCLLFLGIGMFSVIAINLWKCRRDITNARQFAKGFKEVIPLEPTEKVSVLVAAWNESEHIQKHIESFLNLRYGNKELILCAGGTDDTLAIAKTFIAENIVVLEQLPGEGKQKALRRCYDKAKGSIIFLTDADCYLEDSSFEMTLKPIFNDDEQATTGSMYPKIESTKNIFVMSQAVTQLYGSIYSTKYSEGILGCNCAFLQRILDETHAFKRKAPSGTDYILAKTLIDHKIKIRHVPHSMMKSEYHHKIFDYIHQQWRWAKNVFFYGRHFNAAGEVQRVVLNSIVGLMMMLLPISFFFGLNLISVLWILLFLYALCARWRYIATVKLGFGINLPKCTILFQPVMLLIDFIAWARPLPDYIFNTGKETW